MKEAKKLEIHLSCEKRLALMNSLLFLLSAHLTIVVDRQKNKPSSQASRKHSRWKDSWTLGLAIVSHARVNPPSLAYIFPFLASFSRCTIIAHSRRSRERELRQSRIDKNEKGLAGPNSVREEVRRYRPFSPARKGVSKTSRWKTFNGSR